MANATANVNLGVKSDPWKIASPVVSGQTMWAGAMAAGATVDHGTAGTRGYVTHMEKDVNGLLPLGFVDQKVVGDGSLLASINLRGSVIRRVAMTDVAGDITDTWLWVYSSFDGTPTLTRPSTIAVPIGITVRFNAVDDFDVLFFGFEAMAAMALAGYGRQTWFLGCIEPSGASGNALTGIVAPWHAAIISVYTICISAIADADAAYTLNLEIGGTNVTGGVVTIATADALGEKQAGTAVTAANIMHPGDLIDVEIVQGTAGTAGDGLYGVYADCRLLPGT